MSCIAWPSAARATGLFFSLPPPASPPPRYATPPTDPAYPVVLAREDDHDTTSALGDRDGLFYIPTNKDAKNFNLVTAPVERPAPARWQELIPHRADVLLEDVDVFANHSVAAERERGYPSAGDRPRPRARASFGFPDPVYSVSGDVNPEFDTAFRFRYQFLSRRRVGLRLRPDSTPAAQAHQGAGGFDPTRYISERIFATADGTRIPISLVYRRRPATARARCCCTATAPTEPRCHRVLHAATQPARSRRRLSPWPTFAAAGSGRSSGTTRASC